MSKLKVRKKHKHLRTFEEDLKNEVIVKNKILKTKKNKDKHRKEKFKIKKNEMHIHKKKRKDDVHKILNLANEQNEEDLDYDINNIIDDNNEEADKFLQFDDIIEENITNDNDIFYNENKNISYNTYREADVDAKDIFEDLNIKIMNDSKHVSNNKVDNITQESNISAEDKVNSLVEKCYRTIGEDLAHYKSGKLHRALTILTKSLKWYEYLLLTKPKKWTPHATFEITKLFSSGLKEKEVSKFYEFILLPIILENIDKNKKLDAFLYKALIKALYKSKSWFKGILFPVLKRECTNKQIIIIGSVIQKMSISINCVVLALEEIFSFPWNSIISYILILLFNKKYAFTKQCIDNCVNYFLRFENYQDVLSINWHKSLLTLVHNYRGLLCDTQVEALTHLVKKKNHHQISSEIMKELYSPTSLMNKIKDIKVNSEEYVV
ncbi:putative U3/U14 snoRNA-associated small subunit rRNA processing protein [Plasmodium gaboni]|uniref:Putative U3/U14 snoRNA-associated small subunit rRNA processing protein n=1 Tax=Plasmodium gaboni TaxID=647221 RepID=A0A151LIL0_9APIC|nr:putative U3/U14 snoRNA-associated small subunit rRNA processing protein [Plasmodium gaboni]KYN98736.1 putative U3/U14 snoRNA-associated small subunit rRNA processing protein [Plasmodium gaboni]SOV23176.1 U3/U14 snoRNA-associated small subunit rRNA processing protein, putative [Plasmodium sp. DRC-Itaito]